ncbi:transporter substrate-binding domain-containing protein [Paenibacillus filicis]|uniref:Transporter substrate-binding domain-containing protein n=1 Tax=Paenibacillus filicis TaxID=669464 RepID=A0ABU9DCY0_9BACL
MKRWTRKSMALTLSALLLTGLLTACGKNETKQAAAAPEKVIRIGTNASFYPYTFKDTTGSDKLDGYEIDIWNELARELGYRVEWKIIDFASLFGALEAGQIDTIANSIATTEERKSKYDFAEPYVYSGARLVVKKGNDKVKSLADLKGKKIGVLTGSPTFVKYIKEADPEGKIEIVNYETAEGGFTDVAVGRIEATFTTTAAGLAYIKKTGQPLQIAGDSFTVIPAASVFVRNEANKERIKEVNKGLEKLVKSGKLAELSKKWFGEDLSKPGS